MRAYTRAVLVEQRIAIVREHVARLEVTCNCVHRLLGRRAGGSFDRVVLDVAAILVVAARSARIAPVDCSHERGEHAGRSRSGRKAGGLVSRGEHWLVADKMLEAVAERRPQGGGWRPLRNPPAHSRCTSGVWRDTSYGSW